MSQDPFYTTHFADVFRSELKAIQERRNYNEAAVNKRRGRHDSAPGNMLKEEVGDGDTLSQLQDNSLRSDLCGLALSGGGIRSATFSLGVLQGLAALGLLPRFDYLSTVSGGGYIGSWFLTWVHRDGLEHVLNNIRPARLRDSDRNPDPGDYRMEHDALRHLRLYSNYLAPIPGVFSFDGWVMVAIFLRNLMLNQLVFQLGILSIFFSIQAVMAFFALVKTWDGFAYPIVAGVLSSAAMLGSVFAIRHYKPVSFRPDPDQVSEEGTRDEILAKAGNFLLLAVLPFVLAAGILSALMVEGDQGHWFSWSETNFGLPHAAWTLLSTALAMVFFFGLGGLCCHGTKWIGFGAGVVAGLIGSIPLYLALWGVQVMGNSYGTIQVWTVMGVPTFLASQIATQFLFVGLVGDSLNEYEREWWSSFNARVIICAAVWLLLFTIVVCGPDLIRWTFTTDGDFWKRALSISVSAIGVLTFLTGLWAANSEATNKSSRGGIGEWLARTAPICFLVGLLIGIAYFTNLTDQIVGSHDAWTLFFIFLALIAATIAACVGAVALGLCVGINIFALHGMYVNRLVRCYLGASRGKDRQPEWLTNFDVNDELALSRLFPGGNVEEDGRWMPDKLPPEKWAPIPILNAALNRKPQVFANAAEETAEKLAFLERQAESFVFTPLYCGSDSTGYCRTTKFADDVKIGTAMATSGAAASPNMGYHSSPQVAALLAIFNIRLGAWFGNPKDPQTRKEANPPFSTQLLFSELAGMAQADSPHIYVSDGGHFENTGVYELIKRRCRFIVAVDSGEDPLFHENVGLLVRKVRIDLGINIDIDMKRVTPDAEGISASHVVVGRILYGDVHKDIAHKPIDYADPKFDYDANQGVIVWLKNAVTGDEPGDVRNYHSMHREFPYETVYQQFFTESQFESYRVLGLHTVYEAVKNVYPNIEMRTPGAQFDSKWPRMFFKSLFNYWLPKPAEFQADYVDQNTVYLEMQDRLKDDPKVKWLAWELYGSPEQKLSASQHCSDGEENLAERLLVNQMMTLLENVWFALDMENNRRHPVHNGWLKVFENWLLSPRVWWHWIQRGGVKQEFSEVFGNFVKQVHRDEKNRRRRLKEPKEKPREEISIP